MRVPCTKCGSEVLEATARANDGLCGPCARGGGKCEDCGAQMWEANKNGRYICYDCSNKKWKADIAAESGIDWKTPEDIHWGILEKALLHAAKGCFARVGENHPGRSVKEVTLAYRFEDEICLEP